MTSRNALSLLAFSAVVAGIAGLILTHHILAAHPLLLAVQVGAVLLMLWARKTMGLRSFHAAAGTSEGGLVTRGPFRYWRHPIYAAVTYFVWVAQIEQPTAVGLALAAVVTLGLLVRMRLEEASLTETYPEYPQYAQRAKRFVPFLF